MPPPQRPPAAALVHLAATFALVTLCAPAARAQGDARDREVAAHFASVFHQALGEEPRADFVTRFDFDGDWRGDNNWASALDPRHRPAASSTRPRAARSARPSASKERAPCSTSSRRGTA